MMGMTTGGPASAIGYLGYAACSLPFVLDMLISLRGATNSLREEPVENTGCTVEEINNPNQENFLSAEESYAANGAPRQQEEMLNPSSRLLPEVVAENDTLYNLTTSDWKENAAYESQSNTTVKQLTAFAMIAAYMYLGGSAVESHAMVPLGALTLGYASSSLVGYFGMGQAPLAKFLRTNMVSGICACIGAGSILSSGLDLHILLLTMLHAFDTYVGASQENKRNESQFENFQRQEESETATRDNGPIMNFFTESWKNNSFNKKNYATCQTV